MGKTAQYSEEIMKGFPVESIVREMIAFRDKLIKECETPIAHGTSSAYLASILKNGLGAIKPKNAFSPADIFITNLFLPDGLLGAYAFALREEIFHCAFPRFFKSHLRITAEKNGGRNVIQRYVETIVYDCREQKKLYHQLVFAGALYIVKRRRKNNDEFPVMLLYDAKQHRMHKTPNKIPSDYTLSTPLPTSHLIALFVPAQHYAPVKKTLGSLDVNVIILPLELFELEELIFQANKTKYTL